MAQSAQILLILLAINGAPVLAAWLMGPLLDAPVDGGRKLADGRALFGADKTWRGLVAMLFAGTLLSTLLGYGGRFGLVLALLATSGDVLSSYIKRRRGLAPGTGCIGLDQLPESALPSLYAVATLDLHRGLALALPLAFMLSQILLSQPLLWLRNRKRCG